MARINKELTTNHSLEEPFPSSPVRNARFHLIMSRTDDTPTPPRRMWTWAFYSLYAAKRVLDFLISDREVKWIDDNHIILNGKLKVTSAKPGNDLCDILEHELTPAQHAWEIPHDFYRIGASMFVDRVPEYFDRHAEATSDKSKPAKAPKPEKQEKKSPRSDKPSGLVDLPQVIADVKPPLDAKEARTILRKHATKPEHGSWAWPAAEVPAIVKLLKEHRK